MRDHRALLACALALAACAPREQGAGAAAAGGADSTAPTAAPATRLAATEGFSTPESVLWDAEQQVWFVSNINGPPTAADGNGFISRLRADGSVDSLRFIQGGRNRVILHAPKGMALIGDTLWVSDIDVVRSFHRRTGAPLGVFVLGRAATFLNDVVAAGDGGIYVTDTGVRFTATGTEHPNPDRIFYLKAGLETTVAVEGDSLERPNGIAWDATRKRFVVVPFGGTTLWVWMPGTDSLRQQGRLARIGKGPGQQDGVEVLDDGRVVISSWTDSTVFAIDSTGNRTVLVKGVPSPADIGLDRQRGVIAVPLFMANRVEFWQVK